MVMVSATSLGPDATLAEGIPQNPSVAAVEARTKSLT
jgi:hypothetical protein